MKRVLLVHPGNPGMSGLRQHLEYAGLEVDEADYPVLTDYYADAQPDLLVLNSALHWEAVEFCAKLRTRPQWSGIPVVLIGEPLAETERILALELGADEYVSEPFSPREVAARIKAHLRRPVDSVQILRAGALELNRERRDVLLEGRSITLTPNEFRMLEALMGRVGMVFSERQLMEHCWGKDSQLRPGAVKVHIRRLRRKLGDDPVHPRIIRSKRGFGYSLEPA